MRELRERGCSRNRLLTPRTADGEVRQVRTLATRALTAIGFSVITAADGIEGVERFRESGGDIGCILMDMTMPRLDGEGALHAIRKIRPDARVILMSGYDRASTLRRFPSDRVDGFLQKPFGLQGLREMITSVVGGPPDR